MGVIMASDLNADIEELSHLLTIAKRPRIRALLTDELQQSQKVQVTAESKVPVKIAAPLQTSAAKRPETSYTTLGSFSWDQDNEKIKVYLFLEGVNEEKVVSNFSLGHLMSNFMILKEKIIAVVCQS